MTTNSEHESNSESHAPPFRHIEGGRACRCRGNPTFPGKQGPGNQIVRCGCCGDVLPRPHTPAAPVPPGRMPAWCPACETAVAGRGKDMGDAHQGD